MKAFHSDAHSTTATATITAATAEYTARTTSAFALAPGDDAPAQSKASASTRRMMAAPVFRSLGPKKSLRPEMVSEAIKVSGRDGTPSTQLSRKAWSTAGIESQG